VAKARQEIADDTPIGGKQRSPAHVRAIMAYLQLRSARKLGSSQRHIWSTHIDDLEQKLASMTEEAEYQRRKKETYQDRLKHQGERIASHAAQQTLWESIASEWGYAARTDAKRRRAVLKARDLQNRLYAEYKIVDRANDKRMEAERELASLKQKLADPTNPARESDLLMLRDNAEKWQGKAEAAIAEGERLKQQVVHYGGQIENLAVRLARAEAMLRADPLQLTRIAA
jgi:chromosome segregation ATPase